MISEFRISSPWMEKSTYREHIGWLGPLSPISLFIQRRDIVMMAHLPVPPPSPCTPIIVKVDEQVLTDGDISFQIIKQVLALVVLDPIVDGESGSDVQRKS